MADRLTEKRLNIKAPGRFFVTYEGRKAVVEMVPSNGGHHNSCAWLSIHVYA
jgi:hypothetical protein